MDFDIVKKVKHSAPFTLVDIVTVAVLALGIGLTAFFIFRVPPACVRITTESGTYEYPLGVERTVELERLTVHISGGEVWVTDAQCADRTCEHTGRINRAGQSIVCLPNNVVVTITGKSELQWETGR